MGSGNRTGGTPGGNSMGGVPNAQSGIANQVMGNGSVNRFRQRSQGAAWPTPTWDANGVLDPTFQGAIKNYRQDRQMPMPPGYQGPQNQPQSPGTVYDGVTPPNKYGQPTPRSTQQSMPTDTHPEWWQNTPTY